MLQSNLMTFRSTEPKKLKREILHSSNRGWVSNAFSMMDCFTTGIVIYKQGNYLWSTVRASVFSLQLTHTHTQTHTHIESQLIYINGPAAVSLLLLPLLWPLSLYQLPTHACTPSPSFLLFSIIIPGQKTGGGGATWRRTCPPPPPNTHTHTHTHTHSHSMLYLNTPTHEFTCMTGCYTGLWWVVCLNLTANTCRVCVVLLQTLGGSRGRFKTFEKLLCFT